MKFSNKSTDSSVSSYLKRFFAIFTLSKAYRITCELIDVITYLRQFSRKQNLNINSRKNLCKNFYKQNNLSRSG